MTIAAIHASARKNEGVYYSYVCSWECADEIESLSRSRQHFEDGYELNHETICDHCGKRIKATAED